MKNPPTDPRPGRRPRTVPARATVVDVGEVDDRPISLGFDAEPDAPDEPTERDYRAHAKNPPERPSVFKPTGR